MYASARHVTAPPTSAARELLCHPDTVLYTINNQSLNCYANSGATHHMLNGYATFVFVLYYILVTMNLWPLRWWWDPITYYGGGTTCFLLNGKCVKALHSALSLCAWSLESSLFSSVSSSQAWLWVHFKQFDMGSYIILFPYFIIVQVDDSTDNLVSFMAIWHSKLL